MVTYYFVVAISSHQKNKKQNTGVREHVCVHRQI